MTEPKSDVYIVVANKYHFDKGLKWKDYSRYSYSLTNSTNGCVFAPKSITKHFDKGNGDHELHIAEGTAWLKENKRFLDDNTKT